MATRIAHNRLYLAGKQFGRLTVMQEGEPVFYGRDKKTTWVCRCECGSEITVHGSSLTTGNTKSCGCKSRDILLERNTKHGLCKTKVHRAWQGMLNRCRNKKIKQYNNYGGRGIKVCDRWLVFENFLEDMGIPEPYQSLDRINNDGDYEPDNCRWATNTIQCRNKRTNRLISFDGKTMPLIGWAEQLGIDQSSLRERLESWPLQEALTRAPKQKPISKREV